MTSYKTNSVLVLGTGLDTARKIEATVNAGVRYQSAYADAAEVETAEVPFTPDVVIFDVSEFTENELAVANSIRSRFGDIPIIVTSEALGDDQVRRLFKLKVHDWLRKPLTDDILLNSLRTAARAAKVTGNQVHAVVSAVGGAGATTVALSMANLLVEKLKKTKESVAVFDLDFSTGDCSYVLNMLNAYNLESVAAHPERIDVEFINLIQQRHEEGFFVYSFKRPDINGELNGYELVLRMLDAVNLRHEHTILDIPYYETEWKSEVLSAVNSCTVVSLLNLPAIKHTLDIVERIQEMRGKDFQVKVAFNQTSSSLFGQRIKKSKIEELFGDTPFYFLSEDSSTLDESVDRGLLPSAVKSSSKFLKSLRKYMKTVDFDNA